MRNSRSQHSSIVAGLMLASCLAAGPAAAAGLLGGVLGGTADTGSLGGSLTSSVSGLLGSGGPSGTGVGVPGVASATVSDSGTGTSASGTVLGGGGSTIDVGLHGVLGDNSSVSAALPGTGIASVDSLTYSLASTTNGLTGNGGTLDTTVGTVPGLGDAVGGLGGLTGLLGGSGGGTTARGGGGASFPGGVNSRLGSGGLLTLANLGAGGIACSGRASAAIAQLLDSHSYDRRTLSAWRRAGNVQVVPVRLCPQLRASVSRAAAANSNVAMVQDLAAADPLVRASLDRTRYRAGNVLAVDQSRGLLTVYVY